MRNFAVIENEIITNVIIADTIEIAEEVTGKTCMLLEEDSRLGIGWFWDEANNCYLSPKPYPSWNWDNINNVWVAPVELVVTDPLTFLNPVWDEESLSWVEGPELESAE